jgi:hypothetical protein
MVKKSSGTGAGFGVMAPISTRLWYLGFVYYWQLRSSSGVEKAMAREKALTVQRTVYLSPLMAEQLDTLAAKRGNGDTANDLIREAAHAFLDDQVGVLGSRRHFQKSFQGRIDQLETNMIVANSTLLFYANIVIQLLVISLAPIVTALTKQAVSPQALLQKAVIQAKQEQHLLTAQVEAVREMSSVTVTETVS